RLAAVGESYESFSFPVVVRRPDDERRFLAADTAPVASLVESAPVADEWILLPLATDRRLVRVARKDAQLVGKSEQDVHHRAAHLLVVTTADGVLEERVSGEDHLVVDHERYQ